MSLVSTRSITKRSTTTVIEPGLVLPGTDVVPEMVDGGAIGTNSAQFILRTIAAAIDSASGITLTYTSGTAAEDGFVATLQSGVQLSYRSFGASQIYQGLEPTGSLTAAGDSGSAPTGTSAEWFESGLIDVTVGSGAASKIVLAVFDDAAWWYLTNTANSVQNKMFHAGEIWVPSVERGEPPSGRDGLGMLGGSPIGLFNSGGGGSWILTGGSQSFLRVQDGVWGAATTGIGNGSQATDQNAVDGLGTATYTPPGVSPCGARVDGKDVLLGVWKYLGVAPVDALPMTVVDYGVVGDQGWLHFYTSTTATPNLVMCDATFTP